MTTEVLTPKSARSRNEAFASRASRSFLESFRAAEEKTRVAPKVGAASSAVSSPRSGRTARAAAEGADWTLVLKTDKALPAIELRAPGSPVERTTEAEVIFQLGSQIHLLRIAEEVFGSADDARRWFFDTPQPALDGKTAAQEAATASGVAEVEDMLLRIAHGVFA